MSQKDHYQTLGVGRSASPDEIKRAYRKLSKKYHPDRNPDDAAAEHRFKEVQQAYEVLRDADKRAQYDEFGDVAVGQFHTHPGGQRVYEWGGGSTVNVEDMEELFTMFGFGGGKPRPSVFDQFFGRGGRRAGPSRPRPQPVAQPLRGANEEKTLNLTFKQACVGATVTVRLKKPRDPSSVETLEVKVPPGIEDGRKIRIAGRGHPGANGGKAGDLLLVCAIKPHPHFTRQGDDIYLDVPVTISEAVLGAKIEVPSLDGPVTVTIPPGTTGGAKLRLRGRGVRHANGGSRGHQYVVIQVVPPASLSEEQQRLFEALREQEKQDADQNPRAKLNWDMEQIG